MIGRLALLLVLAVGWVAGQAYKPDYMAEHVADKDYLLKLKRIYQVLYHVTQPELKADLYKEGQDYKIEYENYINKDAVKEFMNRMEYGFLPHDSIFSLNYVRHIEEFRSIFKILYYAKDFDTFYKTALFCRNRLNHAQFTYAFFLAVMNRQDTKYMKMPPPYELVPYLFYNRELLEKVHHPHEFAKLEPKHSAGYDAYVIPYNYSNHYLSYEYDYEQRLNYFTEDIGMNTYYFYFRSQFPPFLSGEEFGFNQKYRGEEYLYGHKQILSRYNLERLSNDLGSVEDFDWSRPFYPGYWPSLAYPNGLQFPSRPSNSFFPKSKYHEIQEVRELETRISQAVDSGRVYTKEGKIAVLDSPEGLNILGNIIEGNLDSSNSQYYGHLDHLMRNILGFNLKPLSYKKPHPSALEYSASSMRDPAFYRLYKRLLHYYYRYKENQKPYPVEEIRYPELKIESVDVDKLTTYFDYFDSTISNGLAVENEAMAEKYVIQARQSRLNHKHFALRMNINAEKPTKAVIRIFLGPKVNVHNKEMDFTEHFNEFYELDNFIYDLSAGSNKIERGCHDFFFVDADQEPSEVYYKRILKAIEGTEELKYQKRVFAFPQRLLLPKGKAEGLPLQFFVHVAPVQGVPMQYSSRIFGESLVDNRAFGYPLDRPVVPYEFRGPNFFFKDVLVYHMTEHGSNVAY